MIDVSHYDVSDVTLAGRYEPETYRCESCDAEVEHLVRVVDASDRQAWAGCSACFGNLLREIPDLLRRLAGLEATLRQHGIEP